MMPHMGMPDHGPSGGMHGGGGGGYMDRPPAVLGPPDIVLEAPSDPRLRFTIDTVACYVLRDGCSFEQALMEREMGNPEYAFLFQLDLPEHLYYR